MNLGVSVSAVTPRRLPKGNRADTALGAPEPWRTAARAVLDSQPRGAYRRCAAAVGCKPATLTQLLDGMIAVSPLVSKISKYLDIPLPGEVRREPDEIEVNEIFRDLEGGDRDLALGFLRRLKKKLSNGG